MEKKIVELISNKYPIGIKELSIVVNELHTMKLKTDKDRALATFIAIYTQTQNLERTLLFIHKVNKLNLWNKLESRINVYDKIEVMRFEAETIEDIEDYKMELFIFYSELERDFGKLFLNSVLAFYNNYGIFEEIMMDLENEDI